MALIQREIEVRILVETEESNMRNTLNFVKTSVKGSCRNLLNGSVVLGLYDEHDRLIGLDITGEPSQRMQDRVESLFPEENREGEG